MRHSRLNWLVLLSLSSATGCGIGREMPSDNIHACVSDPANLQFITRSLKSLSDAYGYNFKEDGDQTKKDLVDIANGSSAIPEGRLINVYVLRDSRVVMMANNYGPYEKAVLLSVFNSRGDPVTSRFSRDVVTMLRSNSGITVRTGEDDPGRGKCK